MRFGRNAQRTVNGFKLPWDGAMTENERTWVEFLLTCPPGDPSL